MKNLYTSDEILKKLEDYIQYQIKDKEQTRLALQSEINVLTSNLATLIMWKDTKIE